MRMVILKLF